MKLKHIAGVLLLLCFVGKASAHRLDEYLQATLISITKTEVRVSMRLIPGVAVAPSVIAEIDSNGDGELSQAEQLAYAERVLGNLTLTLDGHGLQPRLVSVDAPTIEQMKNGLGEIHIEYTAELPQGGPDRRLVLVNRNQNAKAVYLVNGLVPADPELRIVAQNRNETQSFYELDYTQAGGLSQTSLFARWTSARSSISALGLPSLFRLGMRHIAEGTDHLLFLLVLLLPAPLVVLGSRWAGSAGVRSSLLHILSIVTAFTIGHSLTLALAAFHLVYAPARPVEVLIAVSILVSAIHAMRPIFPGREAGIAAFFGLIHGLAFASTLNGLGLGNWQRMEGILAFNLGIETMQMVVVAATMPTLLLLSRTRWYSIVRVGGAVFAALASIGWIAERTLGIHTSVDLIVNGLARYAVWFAAGFFVLSVGFWARNRASAGHNLQKSATGFAQADQ